MPAIHPGTAAFRTWVAWVGGVAQVTADACPGQVSVSSQVSEVVIEASHHMGNGGGVCHYERGSTRSC
ncbi:unnamed protein product [Merluccius merluccius]